MLNSVEYLESLGFETVEVADTKTLKHNLSVFVLGSATVAVLLTASIATPVILFHSLFQ